MSERWYSVVVGPKDGPYFVVQHGSRSYDICAVFLGGPIYEGMKLQARMRKDGAITLTAYNAETDKTTLARGELKPT